MSRWVSCLVIASLMLALSAPATRADVNVNRSGSENPMVEVAKSTVWGGLAGLMLGAAVALATEGTDSDGNIIRWSFVGGTFLGFGVGAYHVMSRPSPTALLELENGAGRLHAVAPVPAANGGAALHLVTVRF
jgi:hypothetical protein